MTLNNNKLMFGSFFREGVFVKPKEYEEDIEHLRKWLLGQSHLPGISDEHLYLFLHSCEQNLPLTKTTIEKYYSFRTHSPELFSNRDPLASDVQNIYNLTHMVPLSRTTPEGYKVIMYRLTDYDAAKYQFIPALRAFFMFNDMRLAEDGLVPGYVVIFDMKGLNMGHLTKVSLTAIRKFMTYIQDCHPARLKSVHVINTVPLMDKVLALIKPFMKSTLMHMLHLHSTLDTLEKFVPLEILPEDYGGKSENCTACSAKQRMLFETEYATWFQREESLKVDESKRSDKADKAESFGAEGSFRKLAID